MQRARRFYAIFDKIRVACYLGYFIAVAAISHTLLIAQPDPNYFYITFPILMLTAFFLSDQRLRVITACAAMLVILIGGIVTPLPLDAVEENFIMLPLCFLVLFPGSLWPFTSAVTLVLMYLYSLPAEEFDEFIEDAIELLVISGFATVMMYFQTNMRELMTAYRRDSVTDYLTQIPNNKAFYDQIAQIDDASKYEYGVLQLGLNDFRNVNDSLGYANGDKLLYAFAQRIQEKTLDLATFYRLGGDEFILLVKSAGAIEPKIEQILSELRDQADNVYVIDATSHRINFSMGIALLKDAGGNKELWGKNADVALYNARAKGANTTQWYDDQLLDETIRQHQIEMELKTAIKESQFLLNYQPKVSMANGEIIGAEALIRWPHPLLGVISPAEFIPIAEKTALIVPIGRWVIEKACMQAKAWADAKQPVCVSVNVSPVQFANDDLYRFIQEVLHDIRLPAHLLQIEITESTLMLQPEHVVNTCQKLRDLGVSVAVDDFGVAYSSLNYLKKLPIDVLKIDKSFVDDCVTDHTDHMLVRTIIQIGHNLNKVVIAEGVENDEQLTLLKNEGCDEYQGYLFSKPLDQLALTQLLNQHSGSV